MLRILRQFEDCMRKAAVELYSVEDVSGLTFETTRDLSHGDITSTAPMRLAKTARRKPELIADELSDRLRSFVGSDENLSPHIEEINTSGGFINIRLSRHYWLMLTKDIIEMGGNFGRNFGYSGKAQVEFVSANPTGPLTVAHGRQAAIGDTLARILEFAGYMTTREYYLNDTGNQIYILGKSAYYRWLQSQGRDIEYPENCYQGDYISEIALRAAHHIGSEINEMNEDDAISAFGDFTKNEILEWIQTDLAAFGVEFDTFFSQEEMEKSGLVEKLIETYRSGGLAYNEDNATWLRSTDFGDTDDKVLVKSDGSYTYRTPDIAYHLGKFQRGYDKMVVLLGPDHHAHTITIVAALRALGLPVEHLHYLLVQHCTLYEGEKQLHMSTRRGTFITLQEVVDAVGKDAARFFFLNRSVDSHLNFDLELARKQSSDNPVFYLQYAAARCASILKRAMEDGFYFDDEVVRQYHFIPVENFGVNIESDEIELLRFLGRFPIVVLKAAESNDTLRLINYLMSAVENFHNYYQRKRVMTDDRISSRERLAVVAAFRTVLENGLGLLGVSAPEKM